MKEIVQTLITDGNALLEKIIQAQTALPPTLTDPVLLKVEGAIEGALSHLGKHPAMQPVAAVPAATAGTDGTNQNQTSMGATVAKAASLIALMFLSVLGFAACRSLPGQTAAAPFFAYTNNTAYLAGYPITTNQLQSTVASATSLGYVELVKAQPSATNYIPAVRSAIQALALSGSFDSSSLSNVMAGIEVPDEDLEAFDSLTGVVISLGGQYLTPLLQKDAKAGPYIIAVLQGFVNGLPVTPAPVVTNTWNVTAPPALPAPPGGHAPGARTS